MLVQAEVAQPGPDLSGEIPEMVELVRREVVDQDGPHVVHVRSGGGVDEARPSGVTTTNAPR